MSFMKSPLVYARVSEECDVSGPIVSVVSNERQVTFVAQINLLHWCFVFLS